MIEKIARICYNDKKWEKPSGTYGKSSSKVSYENKDKSGYGHEEWLLDKTKIINGFHYGYLEPIGKSLKHIGKTYKIWLYTVINKKKYLVGVINNTTYISNEEAYKIHLIYKKNGWIKEMKTDLIQAGIGIKGIDNFNKTSISFSFNVKFRIKDVEYFHFKYQLSDKDKNISTWHYSLLPKNKKFILVKNHDNIIETNDIDTTSVSLIEGKEKSTGLRKRHISDNDIIIDPHHDKIQKELKIILSKKYETVLYESERVDLKAKTKNNEWHYYEIKTDTPLLSIRHAIGQLMEYAYYPDKNIISKLIVVSKFKPSNEVKTYLELIRKRFNFPLYYQYFNLGKKYLSQEY